MINFASFFTIGKAHGWGTFPKCGARLSYSLILAPYFEKAPTLGLYLTLKRHHYHSLGLMAKPQTRMYT